jgi:putative transposase
MRKEVWERCQESLTLFDTIKMLPYWKEQRPSIKKVHSQVLQDVQNRVEKALRAFFRRVREGTEAPGYPRFRGKGRYDSFTFTQSGFCFKDGKLRLSKVGDVKIILHRPLQGTVKQLTLHRTATGKWFASFSVEVEAPRPLPATGKVVGVDVGLTSFATLSTGEKVDNPRFFRQEEKALVKAQRKLSRLEKGTPERARARKVVARIHERITWKRTNFIHQLSHWLVQQYDFLAFEQLNGQGMLKNHCLAKSIADAAWHQLVLATQYKAAEAGRVVVLVNPAYTSQTCSRCGVRVPKTLSERIHQCPHCSLVLDRDWNAAINILRLGLQASGIQSTEALLLQGRE